MGFSGFMEKILPMAGTVGGFALGGPQGAMIGSALGSAGADLFAQDEDMPNLANTLSSGSTWMPLAMPNITASGKLTDAAATTVTQGITDVGRRRAAIKQAEDAAQKKALMYMLMGQGGGGGGGGMSDMMLPMMMMSGKK